MIESHGGGIIQGENIMVCEKHNCDVNKEMVFLAAKRETNDPQAHERLSREDVMTGDVHNYNYAYDERHVRRKHPRASLQAKTSTKSSRAGCMQPISLRTKNTRSKSSSGSSSTMRYLSSLLYRPKKPNGLPMPPAALPLPHGPPCPAPRDDPLGGLSYKPALKRLATLGSAGRISTAGFSCAQYKRGGGIGKNVKRKTRKRGEGSTKKRVVHKA